MRRDAGDEALQDLTLGIRRNFEDAEDPPVEQRPLCDVERRCTDGDRDCLVGVEGLDQAAAERGAVVVDDGDRDLADELAEIGLRIEHAVKYRSDDHQTEGAVVGEHAAPFPDKAAGDAAAGAVRRQGFVRFAQRLRRKLPQPPPGEGEEAERHACENREGRGRGVDRRAARGLVEQDLLVPAQRQQGPPAARKPVHRHDRHPDPGKAEGRRRDDRDEAQGQSEVAHQQHQESGERLVGGDEQDRGGDHHRHIAAIGQLEPGMQDQRLDRQQCKEQGEQRQELSGQGDERAAAGTAQPGAPAASRELGADRIGGGDRDDDVQCRRHHRAQQKPGVIERRVGQNVFLDDEPAAAGLRLAQIGERRQPRDGVGDRVAEGAGSDASRREILGVVEGDDLRPADGQEIQLETRRNVDRGDRAPGADRADGTLQIVGAQGDAQSRSRRDRLNDPGGNVGAVGVDDGNIETPDDRTAKGPGQDCERGQRHDDRQQIPGRVAPKKPDLARRHQPQARARRRPHGERLAQSV